MSDTTPGSSPDLFRFDPETEAKILEFCPVSEDWMRQYSHGEVELVATPEAALIMSFENVAHRFLRNKVKTTGKATQKKYLQLLEAQATELLSTLVQFPEIDRTSADPFHFLEEQSHKNGKPKSGAEYRDEVMRWMTVLRFYAKLRLSTNMEPTNTERSVEEARRRTEYPRFVLIADIIATYKRITGLDPTAHASLDFGGRRRVSVAVDLVSVVAPPIMKAARLKSHSLDDQTIKNEIARIKRHWEKDEHPELAYSLANWGKETGR